MLSPETATIIIVAFLVVFGIIMPILNKKLPKFISYRWSVIVVILALLIGAVLDFDALSEQVRYGLIVGGLVIAGGYILLRTVEKALANGWLRGAEIEAEKGDIKVKGRFGEKPETKDNDIHKKD
jgi:fucose permease